MANSFSHAMEVPIKGARFTLAVPYLDADGDPTDPTTPDTEVSKDGAAFADCTEETTTISGTNGMGYITLTGDETNCTLLCAAAKVASGPKNTIAAFVPRVLPVLHSGTAQAGAAGSITLAAGAPAYDLSGAIVKTTGGTGGGGGSGSRDNQARQITAYNTSTKVATVVPGWETNPDVTTTYEVLLTELAVNALLARIPAGGAVDAVPEIADGIFDEALAGHTTQGTFGERIQSARVGTAQAGGTNSITLDASASAVDDFYLNQVLFLVGGTGAGQSRKVLAYVGSTKVVTVDTDWATAPDATTKFLILPDYILTGSGATPVEVWTYATRVLTANTNLNDPTAAAIADAVLDETAAGHTGFLTTLALEATLSAMKGATFDTGTDSLEALRDRGDAAWITVSAATIRAAVGLASANLDTQLSGLSGYVDCLPVTWVVPPAGSDYTAGRAAKLDYLDAAISTRGTGTALDAAAVRSAVGLASANLDTQLGTKALEATLTAIKGDGWSAETLVALKVLVDAVKAVTDKLTTALELDGAVYRWTQNALELAPSGTGGQITVINQDIVSE